MEKRYKILLTIFFMIFLILICKNVNADEEQIRWISPSAYSDSSYEDAMPITEVNTWALQVVSWKDANVTKNVNKLEIAEPYYYTSEPTYENRAGIRFAYNAYTDVGANVAAPEDAIYTYDKLKLRIFYRRADDFGECKLCVGEVNKDANGNEYFSSSSRGRGVKEELIKYTRAEGNNAFFRGLGIGEKMEIIDLEVTPIFDGDPDIVCISIKNNLGIVHFKINLHGVWPDETYDRMQATQSLLQDANLEYEELQNFYLKDPNTLNTAEDRLKFLISLAYFMSDHTGDSADYWDLYFVSKTTPELRKEWYTSLEEAGKNENEYAELLAMQIRVDDEETDAAADLAAAEEAAREAAQREMEERRENIRQLNEESQRAMEEARRAALFGGNGSRSPTTFVDVFDHTGNYIPTLDVADAKVVGKTNILLTIITNVGMIIAVLMLAILGIKYMLSSVEDKAEYKKDMIPYLVGAILLFGITAFVKVLQQLGDSINTL